MLKKFPQICTEKRDQNDSGTLIVTAHKKTEDKGLNRGGILCTVLIICKNRLSKSNNGYKLDKFSLRKEKGRN